MRGKNGQIKEKADEMMTLGQGLISGTLKVAPIKTEGLSCVAHSFGFGVIETRVSTGLEFELLRMLYRAGHEEKPESYGVYLCIKMYLINKIGRKWNILQ